MNTRGAALARFFAGGFVALALVAERASAEPPHTHTVIKDYAATQSTHGVAEKISQELRESFCESKSDPCVEPLRARVWNCEYTRCEGWIYLWSVGDVEYRLEGGAAARWFSVGERGSAYGSGF